jgi:hypothetical protein
MWSKVCTPRWTMNTKIASLLVVGVSSLLTVAGCASGTEETATDQGALEAAAAPFKCTLTLTESIPVKKVAFKIVPGGANGCTDDGIPADQITKTETFNEAPSGAKLLCASHSQGGGNGTGDGVAFFHFRSKVASAEFEMTAECNPDITAACFPKMTGQDVVGFSVMMSGSSADKTEKMAIVHGSLVPRLDKAAGTLSLSILGSHTFVDLAAGETKGGDGSASSLAMVSNPKIELSTSYSVKSIDSFDLDDELELKCAR